MRDQLTLITASSVELTPINFGEKMRELKMLEDGFREMVWFAGANKESEVGVEGLEELGDSRVNFVFEHALGGEAHAVLRDELLEVGRGSFGCELGEGILERGADAPEQLAMGRRGSVGLREGKLDRADDALLRIGEGAVEIEEEVGGVGGIGHGWLGHGGRIIRQGWEGKAAAGGISVGGRRGLKRVWVARTMPSGWV